MSKDRADILTLQGRDENIVKTKAAIYDIVNKCK